MKELLTMTEKTCKTCGYHGPGIHFYPTRLDCKQCTIDKNRAYRARTREKQREYSKRWREKNPERVKELRDFWNAHPKKKEWQRSYVKNNPEKNREKSRRRTARLKDVKTDILDYADILREWGMACHICGLDIPEGKLNFDHVMPIAKGGSHTRENIRPAHARCNQSKGARIL